MKSLILAREKGGTAVWVGDGITRRHIADTTELQGLQYWISVKGGDPTVHTEWTDLRVLGTEVGQPVLAPTQVDYDKLVGDVVDKLATKLNTPGSDAQPAAGK